MMMFIYIDTNYQLLAKQHRRSTSRVPSLGLCSSNVLKLFSLDCRVEDKSATIPDLNVAIYHGAQRQLAVKGKDMVITTYGLLRRDTAKFKSKEWSLVILDEAQAIKNPETDQSKAVKGLKAGAGIAMTGTPVENRLSELWSIFDFLGSGTGLNLTAANHVIHYDLWWNPAVENQATDRVFRIGQQKNVMVNRLITLGTFEEKIDAMIKAKQELTNLTVSAGESWITEMSDRELREIFTLGVGEPV
ncbi:MAG: DEAD/DEAH box helicase [Sulfuricellaceae bacterium]